MKSLGFYIALAGTLLAAGCHNAGKAPPDTPTSGTIKISADESFQPLIDTEISVFESLNPEAHIVATYKSERDCMLDLINDSAAMVIVTRPLDDSEQAYFKGIKMPIVSKALARDAVTLIVNPESKDTSLTMPQIKAIMDGSDTTTFDQVVFDRQNSSLVRYAIDSINEGRPLPANTKVADGCAQVVDYVANNKKALGVIGVSWVSDPYDSTGLSFLSQIRVVGVMSDSTYNYLKVNPGFDPHDPAYARYYFKPYQAYIALRSYQLTRTVYFVLREPYFGLGTGFANFLGGNKGQMIIGKERLFPLNLNIQIRQATIQ